jgi:hypothetical protein
MNEYDFFFFLKKKPLVPNSQAFIAIQCVWRILNSTKNASMVGHGNIELGLGSNQASSNAINVGIRQHHTIVVSLSGHGILSYVLFGGHAFGIFSVTKRGLTRIMK